MTSTAPPVVRFPARVLRRLGALVRGRVGMALGVVILGVLVWRLGTGPLVAGVRGIDGVTVLAALGIGALTTVLSAWRWCLVARGLGIRLPLGRAVADYYRALFLNAALPGGVLGDVHRAVRHGRSTGDVGRGVRAVVLERVAGQVVLVTAGVAVLALWPSAAPAAARGAVAEAVRAPAVLAVGAVVAAGVAVAWWRLRAAPGVSRRRRAARAALAEIRAGVLARGVWPGVVAASVVVPAGFLATFLLAARSSGVTAPAAELLPLMVLALLAMALPLNVGGWGPREGATAWAFGAAGLGAAQGLTVAVVYGVLSLAASLPGLGVLVAQGWAGVRRRQVEFEEGVLAEEGAPRRGARRVAEDGGAGEAESGDAVAEEERRDGDVQPVQGVLAQEAGDGDAAALDQHPAEAPAGQLLDQPGGGERGGVREGEHVDTGAAGGRGGVPVLAGGHHPQGGG